MSDNMKNVNHDDRPPLRMQNVPGNITARHVKKITEDAVKNSSASSGDHNNKNEEQYSLSDDRRVKVLSPGALVARRFFRNRLALVNGFLHAAHYTMPWRFLFPSAAGNGGLTIGRVGGIMRVCFTLRRYFK